jgi:hypothetical protein
VDELSELTFVATARAADLPANQLTLSASGLPEGASFDPATGRFTWTPREDQQGTFTVTFTATDDDPPSFSDSHVMTITAVEVNDPPIRHRVLG